MEAPTERMRIEVTAAEYHALVLAAEKDLRSTPGEARHLIREGLIRLGFLNQEEVVEATT